MLIRHLPYFVVAAEEANLARAADRLGMSGSALTRRIQNLEHELGGVKLFKRNQSGIALTAAGQAFLKDIAVPLDQLDRAARRAERTARGDARLLRIGYNPIALRQDYVRNAFHRFTESYPDIAVELVPMVSQLQADAILYGDLDGGILSVPIEAEGIATEAIDDFPMLLTMNADHPRAGEGNFTIEDLKDENFVGIPRKWYPRVFDHIAAQFEGAGIAPKVICETHCDATLANLIRCGIGVGFQTSTECGTPTSGLEQRSVDGFSASLPLYLAWRQGRGGRIDKLVATIAESHPH